MPIFKISTTLLHEKKEVPLGFPFPIPTTGLRYIGPPAYTHKDPLPLLSVLLPMLLLPIYQSLWLNYTILKD